MRAARFVALGLDSTLGESDRSSSAIGNRGALLRPPFPRPGQRARPHLRSTTGRLMDDRDIQSYAALNP